MYYAGLALKHPKCVPFPLCVFSEELHAKTCSWVAQHLPEWKLFKVKPLAKLLGFYIGPQAGTMMWQGPLTKYKDRINDIKRGCASTLSTAIRTTLELFLFLATCLN